MTDDLGGQILTLMQLFKSGTITQADYLKNVRVINQRLEAYIEANKTSKTFENVHIKGHTEAKVEIDD